MNPSKQAIEAAEKIMGSKAVENTNQSRYRDDIATIVQAAIDEATEPLQQECNRYVRQLAKLQAESHPAQEVDEVGKQIVLEIYRNIKTEEEAKAAIEAHKIKAEDTPS